MSKLFPDTDLHALSAAMRAHRPLTLTRTLGDAVVTACVKPAPPAWGVPMIVQVRVERRGETDIKKLRNDGGDGGLLEKYVNWDEVAIRVLRHHEENVVALENLREEYAAITDGLGAVDYGKDRVSSSTDADSGMVNKMLQKASTEEKIKGLVREERQYRRAWDALDQDEQRILTEFFQRGRRPAQQAVDTLCELYGYEKSNIYNLRRAALTKFKRLLVG